MKTYLVKMALRNISPMVWRRLWISENTSLADLHQIIQHSFNWENEYLHKFHIYGQDYGVYHVGGLMFDDDPYKVFLDNLEFEQGDKFVYEYNFFKNHVVDVRIEEIEEAKKQNAAFCIKSCSDR